MKQQQTCPEKTTS